MRPKRTSQTTTKEDREFARRVEDIIKMAKPGTEEERRLGMQPHNELSRTLPGNVAVRLPKPQRQQPVCSPTNALGLNL